MILVVYDAQADRAYWLYVQAHFENKKGLPANRGKSVTVHLALANVVDEKAIRQFAAAKTAVQAQTKGVKHHEELDPLRRLVGTAA